ncbi:hypothetical protein [Arenibacter lacus]|uniref:hypothetical protein n=1 Tax=Arenibacter lacus TaxID=2608629 RepID=UPI00168AD92E|nr:hypothetical protein [Arenibacter lacus]
MTKIFSEIEMEVLALMVDYVDKLDLERDNEPHIENAYHSCGKGGKYRLPVRSVKI